ncbi:MAG: phage protein Gp36 family protein [Tepidisphaeraceae bacterium]
MSSPSTATGLYSAQADVEDIFGVTNIAIWSQLDPTQPPGTADVNRIQRALDYADARIISFFRNYGNYITPLAPQNNDVTLVTRWAATLAGIWLYESRGLRDDTREANKFTALAQQVIAEMGPYRSQDKLDAARRWPAPTAPAGCD